MSARDQILALLQGPEASRIRFTFPGGGGTVTIAPATFHRVARAIRHGHVKVTPTTRFRAGVGGQYVQPNELQVQPLLGRIEQGFVLHECTHAAYDILKTGITALDEECSAMLVATLYFRMAGLQPPRWRAGVFAAAGDVADGLLRQYQKGTSRIPAVDAAAWAKLRTAALAEPVFFFDPNSFLGLMPGVVPLGGSYTHDG